MHSNQREDHQQGVKVCMHSFVTYFVLGVSLFPFLHRKRIFMGQIVVRSQLPSELEWTWTPSCYTHHSQLTTRWRLACGPCATPHQPRQTSTCKLPRSCRRSSLSTLPHVPLLLLLLLRQRGLLERKDKTSLDYSAWPNTTSFLLWAFWNG
jgi:hypothetical protein